MGGLNETLRTLAAAHITHVVGLPDSTSAPLFRTLTRHPSVRLVTVTREGEAFAIASGLWLGGARPLVVIQNTGLLESGDSLRGTAVRMAAPIPILVTGRGYRKMVRAGVTPDEPRTSELLTRADVDSAALLTEPTLAAWGIPFERCEGEQSPAEVLARTIESARSHQRPSAVIVARALD
ncbi:MAG: thiamine pyrophosphate-binding protein [Gemmatimonadota bacterium]|nr:thiamine pyrophosphate-binding protein [Gemmatimonadota bacterium]